MLDVCMLFSRMIRVTSFLNQFFVSQMSCFWIKCKWYDLTYCTCNMVDLKAIMEAGVKFRIILIATGFFSMNLFLMIKLPNHFWLFLMNICHDLMFWRIRWFDVWMVLVMIAKR